MNVTWVEAVLIFSLFANFCCIFVAVTNSNTLLECMNAINTAIDGLHKATVEAKKSSRGCE